MMYQPYEGENLRNYLSRCSAMNDGLTEEEVLGCYKLWYEKNKDIIKYKKWEEPEYDMPGKGDIVVDIFSKKSEKK